MDRFEDDYRTESEKIAENIKDAILTGEFKMGQRLPQRFLAERFNTTTTVVREALRTVENDGLLHIIPRFGAVVKQIDEKALYGKYIMREAMEVMSARLANQNMTSIAAEKLRDLARQCDDNLPYDKISGKEKAKLHLSLHKYIAEITGVDELMSSLENISLASMMINNAYNVKWVEEYPNWHTRLVDAIIDGTTEEAEEMMRIHVRRGYEMEKEGMDNTK